MKLKLPVGCKGAARSHQGELAGMVLPGRIWVITQWPGVNVGVNL